MEEELRALSQAVAAVWLWVVPFQLALLPVQESLVPEKTMLGLSFLHSNPDSSPYFKSFKFIGPQFPHLGH